MAEVSILKVENLSVSFDGKRVLSDINVDVDSGESVAIIGPNGSGKTVFLRALIGAVPHEGEITWGKDVRIGYVPQRIDLERTLPLTVRDFLLTRVASLGLLHDTIRKNMGLVRLSESFLSKKLGSLSAGQLQRVLIAFALLGDPNVLLFDEPTSGVDLPREEQIYETLHRLQAERQFTLFLVSHDLSLVYRYATRVLCINGRLVCYGTPHHVLTEENLRHVYGDRILYHHHHDGGQ